MCGVEESAEVHVSYQHSLHLIPQGSRWDCHVLHCGRSLHVQGEGGTGYGGHPALRLLERLPLPHQGKHTL